MFAGCWRCRAKKKPLAMKQGANPSLEAMEETISAVNERGMAFYRLLEVQFIVKFAAVQQIFLNSWASIAVTVIF